MLPPYIRSKLRYGHRSVNDPWKPKKVSRVSDKYKHESPAVLVEVFERAEHQANQYSGKQTKTTKFYHDPVYRKDAAVSVLGILILAI